MTASREERFLRLIRGEDRGPGTISARAILSVASLGYRIVVAARNLAFDRGWKTTHAAGIPVVSVGNITVGGTGKTPMVEWVCRWYRERGARVAILSRGYGSGDESVNDEALVLEENLPDVPHLQDPDRVKSAAVAVEELESEVLVLDDGFQHRRLARDIDLVLIDATAPFGLGWLLPRGLLREPVRSLRRADVVVITRADLVNAEKLEEIRSEAEFRAGPLKWAVSRHAPLAVIGHGVEEVPVESLRGKTVAAFCGIGNPEGFRETIEPLCGRVVGLKRFPDHHRYQKQDVAGLVEWATALEVDLVLTTQKDLVKLRAASLGGVPLRALRIGVEVLEGATVLDEQLARCLPKRDHASDEH